MFPWLGTKAFRLLKRYLRYHAKSLEISDIQSEGCLYLTFRGKGDLRNTFLPWIRENLSHEPLDPLKLIPDTEVPMFDKFDAYIPAELLRKEYAADKLSKEDMARRFGGKSI